MDQHRKEKLTRLFSQALGFLVFYSVIVILWGAWVRISHSGDGCGDTWPLCGGKILPEGETAKTWVEYAHRISSGLYGVFVFALFFEGRRLFSKNSTIHQAGLVTLILTVTEAMLGARLVLSQLVGLNDSLQRLVAISLHQVNSLLLVGASVLWFWSAREPGEEIELKTGNRLNRFYFGGFIILAITGAWAALSTTLFPSLGLWEGLQRDFQENSHVLLKIRILHPLLAVFLGSYFSFMFWRQSQKTGHPRLQKAALWISALFIAAILVGMVTLLFLSPIALKITHLAFGYLLWIFLVSYAVISADSTRR